MAKVKGNEPILRLGHGAQLLSQLACRTLGRSDAHSPWWAGLAFALWPVGQLEEIRKPDSGTGDSSVTAVVPLIPSLVK